MRKEIEIHRRVFETGDILDISSLQNQENTSADRCLVLYARYDNDYDAHCFIYTVMNSDYSIIEISERHTKRVKYLGKVDLSLVFGKDSNDCSIERKEIEEGESMQ